jgi:uridine kinase
MISASDITKISETLIEKEYKIISIVGVDGTGKSTIAGLLSKKLNYQHINVDDFLKKIKAIMLRT